MQSWSPGTYNSWKLGGGRGEQDFLNVELLSLEILSYRYDQVSQVSVDHRVTTGAQHDTAAIFRLILVTIKLCFA